MMTREEFSYLTKGSLYEAIVIACVAINKQIDVEDIRIINGQNVIAEGWDKCTEYIVERMYFGEGKIKPCADIIVHALNYKTVDLKIFIANFEPNSYGLNRSGGVGPFIKAYSECWRQSCAHITDASS